MRQKLMLAKPMPEPIPFFDGGIDFRNKWPKALYLDDHEYGRAIEAFPRACSDIIAVDPVSKSLLLAKRIHHATKGVWCFGGGQRNGETPREAAARNLKRETGIEIPEDDLQFLWLSVCFWPFRNPEPQERGEHSIGFTFIFVPTKDEMAVISKSLDAGEYDTEHGIKAYTLSDLESLEDTQKVKLIEYWHAIFG